jgi:hypothetical protein
MNREHRLRQAGTNAAGGLNQLEDRSFVVIGEAVQRQRVLPDDQRRRKAGTLPHSQRRERGRRALDGETHPADLEDCAVRSQCRDRP